jgi:hypothetical protein
MCIWHQYYAHCLKALGVLLLIYEGWLIHKHVILLTLSWRNWHNNLQVVHGWFGMSIGYNHRVNRPRGWPVDAKHEIMEPFFMGRPLNNQGHWLPLEVHDDELVLALGQLMGDACASKTLWCQSQLLLHSSQCHTQPLKGSWFKSRVCSRNRFGPHAHSSATTF